MSLLLGVNVDHVATLRQARYSLLPHSHNTEPSPFLAAEEARKGGADSITLHVRGDRRHVQEWDVEEVKAKCPLPINLEMGNTAEMVTFALKMKPSFVCMVPEKREEVTTEGGLDVARQIEEVKKTTQALQEAGIRVSHFIDPEEPQVLAAQQCGADMIELHTGAFANALGAARDEELERLKMSAEQGSGLGLQVNAGHGINYENISQILEVPKLSELNIGHSIVSRAVFVGMAQAVSEMKTAMSAYSPS